MRKFTLLLTGPSNGIVGAEDSAFPGHPEHYERITVVESAQGDAEPASDFQAEIRTERDFSDEYNSYLAFISGGKSHPYMYIPESLDQEVLDEALRRLNTSPPSAGVPEGWKATIYRIVPDISPEPDQKKYPAEWSVWADRKRIRRELSLLSTPTTPHADGWVKCHMETAAIALEALEFYAAERFKGFGDDPEPYEHHLAQQAISEMQGLVPQPPKQEQGK